MRLNSLYKFYQKYFHYNSNINKIQKSFYAFAIRDTDAILREVYACKSYDPIDEYFSREKKNALTIKFLNNIQSLAESRYTNPLNEFIFFDASINIKGVYLSTNKREIIIPCPYICDKNNKNEVIILTFGVSVNITEEVGVLKGLIEEFNIDKPFPKDTCFITYWDLSSGNEDTEDYIAAKPASRASLISILNEF